MRRVTMAAALIGLLSLSVPLTACENDRDSEPFEQQYQDQYEPQSYVPLALHQPEVPPAFAQSMYIIAGMGVGSAMLIAGVAIPVLLWRHRKQ